MNATGVFARLALFVFPIGSFAQGSVPTKINKVPLDKALTNGSAVVPKPDHLVPKPGPSENAGGVWDKATGQRFFCNIGYTLPTCLDEITALQKVVSKSSLPQQET